MTTITHTSEPLVDEAHVAAAAFLARYSGRTLDAYRHDLRYFFQWASDAGLQVLTATRPHIETYRFAMEERGLAPVGAGNPAVGVDLRKHQPTIRRCVARCIASWSGSPGSPFALAVPRT